MKKSMKLFIKTIAIALAVVMTFDTAVASVYAIEGIGTHAGTQDGTHTGDITKPGDDEDTQDGDNTGTQDGTQDGDNTGTQDGTQDGDNTGTQDGTHGGIDKPGNIAQVIAVTVKGATTYNVMVGDVNTVSVNVITNGKVTYDVDWSTSSDAIAIKGNGKSCTFTAVHGGKAVLTAKVGNKKASIVVNVKEFITEMHFAQDEYPTFVKHKIDFSEELIKTPANGNDEIFYSVDNTKVATVNTKGVVTMKKAGETVLTAATENGVFAQTKIKVEAGNPVTKMSIKQGKKITLKDFGDEAELEVVVTKTKNGGETTDYFEWSSAKPSIVDVIDCSEDGTTATICATGVGTTKVTVKAASGKKASITVVANAILKSIDVVDVATESDSMDTTPLKKIALKAVRDPEVNKDKIFWHTSNKKLATVSSKGVVSIKAKTVTEPTEVIITAANKDATVKDEYVITINPSAIEGVSPIEGADKVYVGEETLYTAEVPGGSADDITWTSSNSKVLSIGADGYATALKAGKVTLKATVTKSNGKTAVQSKKVTVAQATTGLTMKKAVLTTIAGKKKTLSLTAVKSPKNGEGKPAYRLLDDINGVSIKKNKVTVDKTVPAGTEIAVEAYIGSEVTGEVTAECTIVVLESKSKVTFNSGKISKKKLNVKQGDDVDLETTVKPDGNADLDAPVTYKVSKKGIVSVDKDGVMHALHPGSVKITAITPSGAKASVTVKVEKNPDLGDVGIGTGDGGDKGTHVGTDAGKDKNK